MANSTLNTERLRTELPPIMRRAIEGGIDEVSTRMNTRLKAGQGLLELGTKITNSNIDSAMAAARVVTDSWTKLFESTSRSCELAFSSGVDMSRNITAATEGLDSWTEAGAEAEQSLPGVLIERAALFNKTLLNAAQDMTRNLIEPVIAPVATAGMPKDGNGAGGDGHDPESMQRDRVDEHAAARGKREAARA